MTRKGDGRAPEATVPRIAGAMGAMSLLAACGGAGQTPTVQNVTSTGTPTASAPAPSDSSSADPSSSVGSVSASITTGQCVVDTSSYLVVPCTQPHTYQVSAVVQDTSSQDDPIGRQVLRQTTRNGAAATFGGGSPVGLLAAGEPVAQLDDPLNAGRIVCLIYLRTPTDDADEQINYTLKGALAGSAALEDTYCVKKVAKGFKIVACSTPHVGQSTGGYLTGDSTGPYPGMPRLAAQSASKCPPLARAFLGAAKRTDIRSDGISASASGWNKNNRFAACFVKVTSGAVQKSLQGIGMKPLTSYR